MSFVILFPGQGSQSLSMMDSFKDNQTVRELFDLSFKITGVDYFKMQQGDISQINKTINTQPLILISSIAIYKLWQEKYNQTPSFVAGHSLGEWSALVSSNVLSFEDALQLVILRANYMQNAVKEGVGAMAVVLGLDDDIVIELCDSYSKDNSTVVSGVNFNANGQVVIAGYKDAIDGISTLLKDKGAKRVQILPISVPSHCLLMQDAAIKLAKDMDKVQFNTPKIKIVQNSLARYCQSVEEIKESLVQQLYSPVLWHKSIDFIYNQGVKNFIECGPNKVLTGLNKRINTEINAISISNLDDIMAYTLN